MLGKYYTTKPRPIPASKYNTFNSVTPGRSAMCQERPHIQEYVISTSYT